MPSRRYPHVLCAADSRTPVRVVAVRAAGSRGSGPNRPDCLGRRSLAFRAGFKLTRYENGPDQLLRPLLDPRLRAESFHTRDWGLRLVLLDLPGCAWRQPKRGHLNTRSRNWRGAAICTSAAFSAYVIWWAEEFLLGPATLDLRRIWSQSLRTCKGIKPARRKARGLPVAQLAHTLRPPGFRRHSPRIDRARRRCRWSSGSSTAELGSEETEPLENLVGPAQLTVLTLQLLQALAPLVVRPTRCPELTSARFTDSCSITGCMPNLPAIELRRLPLRMYSRLCSLTIRAARSLSY